MATISGHKWGESGLGTPGGVVTWSFVGLGLVLDPTKPWVIFDPDGTTGDIASVAPANFAEITQAAFDQWARYAPIDFIQIADDGAAFGASDHADIRIGVLDFVDDWPAFGFYPERNLVTDVHYNLSGDIAFNTDAAPADYAALLLREIGFAIGMDVSTVPGAVMNWPTLNRVDLTFDDRGGIRDVYSGFQFDPVYEMDAATANLDILQSGNRMTVQGNAFDNAITILSDEDETINGHDGDDTIRAGGEEDRVFGGAGNDEIHGDDGRDTLYGDAGDDVLFGGEGRDTLHGGDGNDTLDGGADGGELHGEGGDDLLLGGDFADDLFGGDGADTLRGGDWGDRLTGGAGADVFVTELIGILNKDRILDFDLTEDRLDFSQTGLTPTEIQVAISGAVDDTLGARIALDGDNTVTFHGLTADQLTMDIVLNSAPTLTATVATFAPDTWVALSDLVAYFDPEGVAPVSWTLTDPAGVGRWWVAGSGFVDATGGVTVGAELDIWVKTGAPGSTHDLSVSASDGTVQSDPLALTLATHTPPVMAMNDIALLAGEWHLLDLAGHYSDVDGSPATGFDLRGEAGMIWVRGQGFVDATDGYGVAPDAEVWIRGAEATGTQTIALRAHDAFGVSAWETVTVSTTGRPEISVADAALRPGAWMQLGDLVPLREGDDPLYDAIEVWDDTGAHNFWEGGDFVDASSGYASSGDLWIQGDATGGTQTLWMRAQNAAGWSDWAGFAFHTDIAPDVAVADQTTDVNAWLRLADILDFADAEGGATTLELHDASGVDNWWIGGAGHVDASDGYAVSADADIWLKGDAAAGSQTLWLRAGDDLGWGDWDAFTFATV